MRSILLLCAALPLGAQAVAQYADGTSIEIRTQSSGRNAPVSTNGTEAVPAGYDFHRLVFNKDGLLFGYDIEAHKDGHGAFTLRAKPINREQIAVGGRGKWVDIPTLSGVREFPALRPGDAVEVEILYNAATGERISDVVQVLSERAPRAPDQPATDRFSFKNRTVTADGKGIGGSPGSWMRCGGMRMRLPDRGTIYLTLNPPPDYPFQAAAWADHKVLRIHAGSELLEITSETNVLQKADFGTVWVWRVPDAAGAVSGLTFHCGDSIGQVLPPK